MKKTILLIAFITMSVCKMFSTEIDSIRVYSETPDSIKYRVYITFAGCSKPTDSITFNQKECTYNVEIFRIPTVPECDCYCQYTDSFSIQKNKYEKITVQLKTKRVIGGSDEEPVYSEYFLSDTKTINVNGTGLNRVNQDHIYFTNPVSNNMIIKNGNKPFFNIKINTISGEQIKNVDIQNAEPLNLESLSTGVYLLIIDNNKTYKFIKE